MLPVCWRRLSTRSGHPTNKRQPLSVVLGRTRLDIPAFLDLARNRRPVPTGPCLLVRVCWAATVAVGNALPKLEIGKLPILDEFAALQVGWQLSGRDYILLAVIVA